MRSCLRPWPEPGPESLSASCRLPPAILNPGTSPKTTAAKTAISTVQPSAAASKCQRAQERQGKRPLVSEPRNKNRSQAQSEQRAGSGKDETFSEQLADNACALAPSALRIANSASCGGARQHEVGEIDAGDQQDSAHGAPQHHKRAAQPSADVVLQWHRHHVALVVVAGLGILQVPAHDRRGRLRIANRLCSLTPD